MNDTKAHPALNLDAAILQATDCINSAYPLTNFIACNALKEWENMPFADAMRKSNELFHTRGFLELSEYRAMFEAGRIRPSDLEEAFQRSKVGEPITREPNIHAVDENVLTISDLFDRISGSAHVSTINKEMVKWCGAYLDRTQAQWKPDAGQDNFYSFWKELAPYDFSMSRHGVKFWPRSVNALPERSQEALALLLQELNVENEHIVAYLRRHILQMPGFASHLKWRQLEKQEAGILTDYLSMRLHYEKMLAQVGAQQRYKCADLEKALPLLKGNATASAVDIPDEQQDYAAVWQDAYELNYRDRLLSSLRVEALPATDNACCQLVFCIDVRSEPLRRRLEQIGPYSTYGFAGFFGMAMRLTELGSAVPVDLCPVLLKPVKEVSETIDKPALASRKVSWQTLKTSALQLKKKLKCNLSGAFGLVELLGLCSAVPLFAKTFVPLRAHRISQELERNISGDSGTRLDVSTFTAEEKVGFAQGAISGIGLTKFGPVVVLCGHKSSSTNNPFASALDCGACGGNGGGFSARLAAQILNDAEVRAGLRAKGIDIPASTVFVAAEHDTTTDQVSLFNTEALSGDHAVIVGQLEKDLASAGEALRTARSKTLPASCLPGFNDPHQRSCDWAQIAPEWGLAGNAAFIAAPRSVSKETDLEGRVFLHSYDYSLDEQNKVLELIMTAPLVVAQWINMQYYLSTVDNQIFGSGSKVVHNVIGDFGVMQGASSDLRVGLPLQSIMASEQRVHEPMRLLAVIRAPMSSIDEVLNKHADVRALVSNRWIRLVALDPETSLFHEAADSGKWRRIKPVMNLLDQQKSTAPCHSKARA